MAESLGISDDLVGRLKCSAIDAWMHDQGYMRRDGHYLKFDSMSESRVTRPAPGGQGGGVWTIDGELADTAAFEECFAQIRETIDSLVAPFRTLPDPDAIHSLTGECRQVSSALSGTATATDGFVAGAGPMTASLERIESNLDNMAGTFIASYKSRFLGQLRAVVGGFCAISWIRCTALVAQESLWTEARTHLDAVLAMTCDAMARVATDDGIEWQDVLIVVGAVARGIKAFVTGGLSTAMDLAGVAVTLLSSAASSGANEQKTSTPGSYDAVIEALRLQLDLLATRIRTEEQLIEDNLRENLAIIERDRAYFDLSQAPVYDLEDTVILEPELLSEVYTIYMPEVAQSLDVVAAAVVRTTTAQVLTRHPSLGIGPEGTSQAFWAMNQVLYGLVKDLAWEVEKGAENLRLAVAAMQEQDALIAERLRRIARRIDEGSPYAPGGGTTDTDPPSYLTPHFS